jgi:hypothetical protein
MLAAAIASWIADSADGRHSVGSIADAQKPRAIPLAQTNDLDGQQFEIVPITQLADAVMEEGCDFNDACAQSIPLP